MNEKDKPPTENGKEAGKANAIPLGISRIATEQYQRITRLDNDTIRIDVAHKITRSSEDGAITYIDWMGVSMKYGGRHFPILCEGRTPQSPQEAFNAFDGALKAFLDELERQRLRQELMAGVIKPSTTEMAAMHANWHDKRPPGA